MGTSLLYRNSRENGKIQDEQIQKIMLLLCFFMKLAKIGPRASGVPSWPSWQSMDVPRPLPTHFTPILHFWFYSKKKMLPFRWCIFEVFHIFPWLFELRRLRDHSQIVDLAGSFRLVPLRALETFKIRHSWQSNVPKRSTKYLLYFHYSVELWRLRDQSQIADLIFAVWTVSSRASKTSKVPHSWQNNVHRVSQKMLKPN